MPHRNRSIIGDQARKRGYCEPPPSWLGADGSLHFRGERVPMPGRAVVRAGYPPPPAEQIIMDITADEAQWLAYRSFLPRPPIYAETMRAGGWRPLSRLDFDVSSDKRLVWQADGKHRMASQAAAGVSITNVVLFTDGGSGDRNP